MQVIFIVGIEGNYITSLNCFLKMRKQLKLPEPLFYKLSRATIKKENNRKKEKKKEREKEKKQKKLAESPSTLKLHTYERNEKIIVSARFLSKSKKE